MPYFDDQTYEKLDYSTNPPEKGNYESCRFRDCNFTNSNLSDINFTDCRFEDCNLSLSKINNTQMDDIAFVNCKMLGLKFEHCNPFLFKVDFESCQLNLSSFYKLKLKKTKFRSCALHEVDFTEADLPEAVFDNCDLRGAVFEFTNLVKADFRSVVFQSIQNSPRRPNNNQDSPHSQKKEIAGLLDRYDIIIE